MHCPMSLPYSPILMERHILPTPGDSNLKMIANRYRLHASSAHGLTLLFTHCIGAHKEQWEPVIEHIFVNQYKKTYRIREAWAFDWQSHGDSAILNQPTLSERGYVWSLALRSFLFSHHVKGHHIIAIGHSAGSAAIMLTAKGTSLRELPYRAIILVEPTLISRELFNAHIEDRTALMDFSVSATSTRRDTWKSREEAFRYFTKRVPWKSWDPLMVRILTNYGLQDTPSGQVTLKCDRKLEAASYPDVEPHFEAASQLRRIYRFVPIHVIWGTHQNDLVPEYLQKSLMDGRVVTSVAKIDDAGHLIVQEKPKRLANVICSILNSMYHGVATRSRL